MKTINGTYASAIVYTDKLEDSAKLQIETLCNQPFAENSKIRIMPDVHAGAGCVIGFSANLGDKVIPNIVGVDIGCGLFCVSLGEIEFSLKTLDAVIHSKVPSGMEVHDKAIANFPKLSNLKCKGKINTGARVLQSIGTLGGGNHFIEVDIDVDGNKYLVIHSGSRNLGKQVADYYQKLAIAACGNNGLFEKEKRDLINKCKANNESHLLQLKLAGLKDKFDLINPNYPNELCFLTGEMRDWYLHDMVICQEYATLNRISIANIILDAMFEGKTVSEFEHFETVHNYVNAKDNIIRKGCISAYKDEQVLIPLNMRDGSLICMGLGNPDWNYSAPHGAGRIMSRTVAHKMVKLEDFKTSMEGIYSTCVTQSTLDESPFAYKPMEEIVDNIGDTVKIVRRIKPIYNFKAN